MLREFPSGVRRPRSKVRPGGWAGATRTGQAGWNGAVGRLCCGRCLCGLGCGDGGERGMRAAGRWKWALVLSGERDPAVVRRWGSTVACSGGLERPMASSWRWITTLLQGAATCGQAAKQSADGAIKQPARQSYPPDLPGPSTLPRQRQPPPPIRPRKHTSRTRLCKLHPPTGERAEET